MSAKPTDAPQTSERTGLRPRFLTFAFQERIFLSLMLVAFLIAAFVFQDPYLAMWVGFAFAGYSAIANDSIQTIGTFIASNREQKWWVLWLFIGGVFVATGLYSWFNYNGDVSYGRLMSKGFSEWQGDAPGGFHYLQVVAPLFLMLLTRLRMPVSTTFMLLTCFATEAEAIGSVIKKSLTGYVLALVVAVIVWVTLGRWMKKMFQGTPHPGWRIAQWCTTGCLWSVWLMQDAANIAVFLPRELSVLQLLGYLSIPFLGLGALFYMRGEKIQEVVDEKSDVVDVRPATILDLVYASVLYYFKVIDPTPMSTTWVFIGLLGGRELALSLSKASDRTVTATLKLMARDILYVSIGLVVSLALAFAVNQNFRRVWTADALELLHLDAEADGSGDDVPAGSGATTP